MLVQNLSLQNLSLQNLSLQNLFPSEAMKVRICVESLVTIRSGLLQRLFASDAAELELQIQHTHHIEICNCKQKFLLQHCLA
jgi:hypothetical protein